MLEQTNLFLNPNSVDTPDSCFNAIEELKRQSFEINENLKNKFSNGVYIWGTEEVARRILPLLEEFAIPLLGVFDSDQRKIGASFAGYKITNPRPVDKFVVVCSYHQPKHLQEAQILLGENAIGAWELLFILRDTKYLPWNNLRSPSMLTIEEKKMLSAKGSRVHPKSQAEFWKQTAARHFVGILSQNQSGYSSNSEEYFVPGIVKTNENSVFLDLGAYTGDTIERFFNQEVGQQSLRKAIAVEADQSNFKTLIDKFGTRDDVVLLNCAINDELGIIPFTESVNSMGSSALFFEPNSFVPALTIDEIYGVMEFSHVKFDIEGFERRALRGGSKAIQTGNAIWSVASYHLFDDFWVLPSFFSDHYQMHVTRHAPLPWDTTFHFVK
jgi:FkbM family methyltransferase